MFSKSESIPPQTVILLKFEECSKCLLIGKKYSDHVIKRCTYYLKTNQAIGVCGKSLTNIRKIFRYILPAKPGTYNMIP